MRKSLRTIFVLIVLLLPMVVGTSPTLAVSTTLVINEVDYDQPSTDTAEFIEIRNVSAGTINLNSFVLELVNGTGGGASVYNTVDLPNVDLDPGEYYVVCGDAANVANCDLDVSPDSNLIQNGAPDAVALVLGGSIVDAVSYEGNTGAPYTEGSGTGLVDSSSQAFAGISRFPDGTDTDVNNVDLSPRCVTPGAANTEASTDCAPPPPVVTIMEIQGSGLSTPYAGQTVQTYGIVTADFQATGKYGFFLQDPVGDGDPATSDGIFVYDSWDPVDAGDEIVIVGEVSEYYDMTQISGVWGRVTVLSTGNPLPAPVPLVDLPNFSIPEGQWFWEALEGMLVSVENAFVSSATSGYGEFGMLTEADADADLRSGYYAQTKQILVRDLGGENVDYNPERIMVDDSSLDEAINVTPGDRMRSLVGAVDYTYSMYKLQPAYFDVKTHNLPKLPASTRSGGFGNVAITTFNVENLFDLVDNPDKEDEGSTPEPEDLEIQLAKLALAIQVELELPDIIVVQEVENTEILQELGDRVNAAAGTDYMAYSEETSDVRGIEVGFLWDADRVELLGAYQMSGPDVEAWFGPSSPSPGREPLVGVFDINGHEITIVGNHFKSKGGDDPLYGVDWPPNRVTEFQRKGQAGVVRAFVNSIFATDPDALVMVTGDLNDFQFSEPSEGPDNPVAILEGSPSEVPLTNLLNFEKAAETFTYVFDGNAQVLDHMLVSPGLYEHFVAADVLHFNTTTPTPMLENDATSPLSASDHDPLEGRFRLE
jgi:predicted extracellular nuclease